MIAPQFFFAHLLKPALWLIILFPSHAHAAQKPNILFFLVDDMGWQDTSVPFHTEKTQLNKDYRTPSMEKLAAKGLMLTNAYASSICSPSRISLMTGQNAARHGVTCWTLKKNKSPERNHEKLLPAAWPLNGLQPVGANVDRSIEAVTLPEILREHGYHTIHVGKGHFGAKDTPGADPINLGFEVNIAGSYMGAPGSYYGEKNFARRGNSIWNVPGLEKYHGQKINLNEVITREAIGEIEKAADERKPFYLYMSHYGVHSPYEGDRRFLSGYEGQEWSQRKKVYASMLESIDRSLGDLLEALDRLRIADNTVVVFMSDNGSARHTQRNKPLRGCKIAAYEGGSRVPFIALWPGVTPSNARSDTPILIEDIFPSFLEMAGVKDIPQTDGVSFNDILKNPETNRPKRALIWHYPNLYHEPPYSSIRVGDLKLIYWHATQSIALYDLAKDMGEKTDISAKNPIKTRELAKILSDDLRAKKAHMLIDKTTGKPIPMPDEIAASP